MAQKVRLVSFFLVLVLGLATSSCTSPSIDNPEKRNENWCWFVDEQTGKGEWIPIGNRTTVQDGAYVLFFCNGEVRKTGVLKDGEDADTVYHYNLTGDVISKTFRMNSGSNGELVPDGKFVSYHPNCEIALEGWFENSKPVGEQKKYYESGLLKAHSMISDSTSWTMRYNRLGRRMDSAAYLNDELHGAAKAWFENGLLSESREYLRQSAWEV